MSIIDDVLKRRREFIMKKYGNGFAPPVGFDSNIPVRVSRDEFHQICTIEPRVYERRDISGIRVILSS